jgi:hypothetical protein
MWTSGIDWAEAIREGRAERDRELLGLLPPDEPGSMIVLDAMAEGTGRPC